MLFSTFTSFTTVLLNCETRTKKGLSIYDHNFRNLRRDKELVFNIYKVLRHLNCCIPKKKCAGKTDSRDARQGDNDMNKLRSQKKIMEKRTFEIGILD